MNIEVLYFEGCPTHRATVELVYEVLAELGLDVSVNEVDVRSEEQASELAFLGSPSIHVDGTDIDPGALGRVDFGRRCRVYPSADGLAGLPPRAWLEAAFLGESIEVDESNVAAPACASASCCPQGNREVVLLVADWCPQCPSAKAYWSELSTELGFSLTTLDIASPEGAAVAERHGVRALPTALVDDVVLGAGVARPDRAVIVDALDRSVRNAPVSK